MLTAAVLVGLLAAVSANGHNMMGGNYGMGNWGNMGMGHGMNNMGHGMNNMGYGMNNMGNGMGMNGMGQGMGNGNGMNQLWNLLSGHMGGQMGNQMGGQMGNNMGGQMGNQMGGGMGNQMGGGMRGQQGQQGIMGGVMLLLLQNLLNNNNNNNRGGEQQDHRMSEDEMEAVEEMMKKKMMMEMSEMMMMHMDFKEKEGEFTMAMEALCFMVNATYEGYKRNKTEVWQKTDDAMMEALGKELQNMTEQQAQEYAINMMLTDNQKYGEVFLRFATWACMTGDSYAKAAMKMEKMERGEGQCGN